MDANDSSSASRIDSVPCKGRFLISTQDRALADQLRLEHREGKSRYEESDQKTRKTEQTQYWADNNTKAAGFAFYRREKQVIFAFG